MRECLYKRVNDTICYCYATLPLMCISVSEPSPANVKFVEKCKSFLLAIIDGDPFLAQKSERFKVEIGRFQDKLSTCEVKYSGFVESDAFVLLALSLQLCELARVTSISFSNISALGNFEL